MQRQLEIWRRLDVVVDSLDHVLGLRHERGAVEKDGGPAGRDLVHRFRVVRVSEGLGLEEEGLRRLAPLLHLLVLGTQRRVDAVGLLQDVVHASAEVVAHVLRALGVVRDRVVIYRRRRASPSRRACWSTHVESSYTSRWRWRR